MLLETIPHYVHENSDRLSSDVNKNTSIYMGVFM